jgi:HD-GYP domain-containing protein (c-di-GMP phosphodiesterase class II)
LHSSIGVTRVEELEASTMASESNEDPEKAVRGLELLLRLGLELHSERDLQSLLEKIWSELTTVMEAERSSLFLVDEESDELYSVVAQHQKEIRFPKGMGIAGAVAATGLSLLIPDAYRDARFNPEIDRKTGFRTRSILSVPLKNRSGEVLGVAQVLNRKDMRPFQEEDRIMLEALASMAAVAIETVQLYEEQKSATEAVISGLVMALDMRDPLGKGHSQGVRACSKALAQELGLSAEEVRRTELAAALHDVGKIAVPDRVLLKDSPLTPEERTAYEAHALLTREFLEAMEFSGELSGVEAIAPYHHKGFSGGGFPPGPPEAEEVPLEARIIAVADALWARMAGRWGEGPVPLEDALEWIRKGAGVAFDPSVVAGLHRLSPTLEEILSEKAPA